MFLFRRTRDHIPGMNLLDGTSPALHEAATRRHDERLTQGMGMPGAAGAGLDRAARNLRAPRSARLEQGLDAHFAGERLLRTIARGSRTASLDVRVSPPPTLESGSKAGAVDHEPVAHVPAPHACIGLVDLVRLDDLDVRDDSVLPAVVEHLLGLADPADVGAREALVPEDERAGVDRRSGRGIGG